MKPMVVWKTRNIKRQESWVAGALWGTREGQNIRECTKATSRLYEKALGHAPSYYLGHTGGKAQIWCQSAVVDLQEIEGVAKPAALLALRHTESPSWIGVFPISDGLVWMLQVHEGRILPAGDRLLAPDEASKIIAQKNKQIEFPVFRTETVEESHRMFSEWRSKKNVRRVPSFKKNIQKGWKKKALIIALMMILAGIGAVLNLEFNSVEEQPALTDEQRQAILDRHKKEEQVFPWHEAPSFIDSIAICMSEYRNSDRYESGWRLIEWSCNGEAAKSRWERDFGLFSDLPDGAKFDPTSPNTASYERLLPSINSKGQGMLADVVSASQLLMDAADRIDATIGVEWGGRDTQNSLTGYIASKVRFERPVLPSAEFFKALSAIPSMTLSSIKHSERGWSIEANLYSTPLETGDEA